MVFTNWPNTFWSVDCFQTANDLLTATGWDNYSRPPGLFDWREPLGTALHHDLSRCAGPNGKWLVSEQAAQVPAHADPDGVFMQTIQDFAHGAFGTVFFEWRPPLGGAEQGYVSVLNPDGSFGPAESQHRRLAEILKRLGAELADTTIDADVALIFSYDNQWEQGFWSGPDGYDAEAERWYKGAKRLRRNIDVIPPAADLKKYRIAAAPNLRIVSDVEAKNLIDYVNSGGILLINSQSATRAPTNQIREVVSPGLFAEIAGIRVTASASRDAMAGNLISGRADQGVIGYTVRFDQNTPAFPVGTMMDGIELRGARPIATFTGGRMEGRPAITVHASGRGHVIFVGTDSRDAGFYDAIFETVASRFSIPPLLDVPMGVDVVSRRCTKTNREFLFVMNWTTEPRTIRLPRAMEDKISDRRLSQSFELASLDAVILV
jgi:beta-galactosidase